MNVDERDTRLGELLDRAVRGIEVAREPAPVVRRGSRRRVGVLVASVTAVAVFLAGVGFAATQVGRDVGDLSGLGDNGTFASPVFPWTMPVPGGWHAGGSRFVGGPRDMLQDLRTSFVTNSGATLHGSVVVGSELQPGVADTDVIVVVDPFVGTGEAQPMTLVLNAERDDTTNAGWVWREGRLCGDTGCARVYVWHGPDASEPDLETARSVAEGVRLVRSRPDPAVVTPTVDYLDNEDGLWAEVPAGWTLADENLTPNLTDPREILSVGTFPLRVGGRAATDAFLPGNAIADLGSDDVFVTVQERHGARASDFPARPRSFSPSAICADGAEAGCAYGTALGLQGIRAWWIPFADPVSGRGFYSFVAMGEDAYRDPAINAAAWRLLDSLAFDATGAPVAYPVPALGDYDYVQEAGGGSRIWPRSGSAEIGVHYRFEVGHCGLAYITDFDGSFWQPILRHAIGAGSPSVLINSDRGTIRMSNTSQAVYTSSTDVQVGLLRLEGSIVVGGCR